MSKAVAIQEAEQIQQAAARDENSKTRVIAGPGSGKSKVIEDRIQWLLGQGINPRTISVLSFTNASVRDLRERILEKCKDIPEAKLINVSTIHSLALRLLKEIGALSQYPAHPIVLNDWELKEIFDPEFGAAASVRHVSRRSDIRRYHEAVWETGREDHPNYRPPAEAITREEITRFNAFHSERTQVYACVLPGEIVNKSLELMRAGILDPVEKTDMRYLIVDEFQDLNPTDLEFIYTLIELGVNTFIAGDDDQSVYSFRYASPSGIQQFTERYSDANHHELTHCFRCPPDILSTAYALITSTQGQDRINKSPVSIHSFDTPIQTGYVHRWRFQSGQDEADAIATSCTNLIKNGIDPNEILILLRNKRALASTLKKALEKSDVPYSIASANEVTESITGRALLAILRVVCEGDDSESKDYIAHRTLLGLQGGVGPGKCNSIVKKVVTSNLNFRSLFYDSLPSDIFTPAETKAIEKVSDVCKFVQGWRLSDTLEDRDNELTQAVDLLLRNQETEIWTSLFSQLPEGMTLKELRDYVWADSDEAQLELLQGVLIRLNEEGTEPAPMPAKVKIMSMHGAKGLSAQVVFVPGLEEGILPANKSRSYPGLVQEEARLLYVSVTRAKALCVLSYATSRFMNGKHDQQSYSQFVPRLNGPFTQRSTGLNNDEVFEVIGIV